MSQIDELQARITGALDRIAAGLEARPAGAQAEEMTALRAQIEEERLANAQLEERVRVLHERLAAREADLARLEGTQSETMGRLDRDLQALRRANQQLRENNQALRTAHQSGVAEPHLINKSMLTELEALRAAHAADRSEVDAVLGELGRVLAGAEGGDDTTQQTENV